MPRRTLIRGANWIGDTVMSLAAVRELRRLYPQDRIVLLARRWVADIFSGQGLVDEVVRPEDLGGGLTQGLSLRRSQAEIQRAVLFPNAFRAAFQVWTARIPERIGYDLDGRGFLLTHRASPRIASLRRHQVYYYLDLLFQTGLADRDYLSDPGFRPDIGLKPSADWIGKAQDLLEGQGADLSRPLVVLNPGAYFGSAKRWFPQRYAQVADLVIERFGAEVAIVGSAGEKRIADEIAREMRAPPRILSGATDLMTLMGVLAASRCFVTNDSGPMHLAAALGVAQVALFGSTDDVATGPFSPRATVIRKTVECSPCLLRECPIDLRCFSRISVGEVAEAVSSVLQSPPHP